MENQIEQWRSIPEFDGVYEVSNFGRIQSKDRLIESYNKAGAFSYFKKGRILKTSILKLKKTHGYRSEEGKRYNRLNILFEGKNRHFLVHTLVARAFLEDFNPDWDVIHLDDNTLNDKADNLKMLTPSERIMLQNANIRSGGKGTVLKLDKYGDTIGRYISTVEAARSIESSKASLQSKSDEINRALNQQAYGFAWKYEADEQIAEWKKKAEKWDKLSNEVSKFYCDKDGEYSEDNPEYEGDLCTIGEVAAHHLGWNP